MNRRPSRLWDYTSVLLVIACLVITTALSIFYPSVLSENEFLKGFINHELLNTLAVILTITLASLANLHIKLNEIEARIGNDRLSGTKAEVKESASWLIGSFIACVIFLMIKGWFKDDQSLSSFFNGLCLSILALNILILIDITRLAFRMPR